MSGLVSFFSRRKGEVLFGCGGRVLSVVGGTPQPIYRTLHFGLKPGHVLYYGNGGWVLRSPGYINYFRPEPGVDPSLNTLRGQRLFGRGYMWPIIRDTMVRVIVLSLWPLHLRIVDADRCLESVRIRDFYLWRRTVDWLRGARESKRRWFYQERTFSGNDTVPKAVSDRDAG